MKKIFAPAYLYADGEFHKGEAVLVDGGEIVRTDREEALVKSAPEAAVIRLRQQALLPGTVNVHNHSFQSLLRGMAVDRPFLEWRDKALYHYSPKMKVEDIYNGALFAFGEMMKYGVTCVSDFFYLHNYGITSDEAVIQAAKDVGIRLVLARTMYDWDGAPAGYVETIDQAVTYIKELARKYNNDGNQMVNILPAPHSLHAASPDMILAGCELAKELGTCYHIHVAEEPFEVEQVKNEHNGMTPIEYLDQLGVVDDHMVIIHGVWLKDSEIKLMGQKGAKLAYCPSSNMFLADGVTKIPEFLAENILIGLGSDGACSNNRISVFEEMRMVSILQKVSRCDAMCLNYKQAFDMGTKNGAALLGLRTGMIQEGYKADFVAVDLDDLSVLPLNDNLEQMLPNIVYSMIPTAVKTVVVNGVVTVENKKLVKKKEAEIRKAVRQTMSSLSSSIQ